MNRGLSHRVVFENPDDRRLFLSMLARSVREGRIELHAYCLLSTHFHLLVRSLDGGLSETMRQIQNRYVRCFNRARNRDGSLFRGRFHSKHVDTLTYRYAVVAYIDANPVMARMVDAPAQYAFGSAHQYSKLRGPPWLCRTWLESVVREFTGSSSYEPMGYRGFFEADEFEQWPSIIERWSSRSTGTSEPLDELSETTPDRIFEWMRSQARLADGTTLGNPVCEPAIVRDLIAARKLETVDKILMRGQVVDRWAQLEVGLLRELCRITLREIGAITGRCESRTGRMCRRHRQQLVTNPEYALTSAGLAAAAMRMVQLVSQK
jgi:REP element-mobilizing transposase RayT